MRKNMVIGLTLICILSIFINVFQFYKMKNYKNEEKFYTKMFENDFNSLIVGFDYYNGTTSALSKESAIKNSGSTVGTLGTIRDLTSYRQNKPMSEMLLYLSEFFVMNSDTYINENIDKIRPQLELISKNLNDEQTIKNLNPILWKMVSNRH